MFNHPQFGDLRTVEISGEPWFVGKDVATALGYSDTFGVLKKHVDAADKQNCQNDSFDTPRGMTIINESGLYALILSSKLPSAKEFKHWVTSEVWKTGGHSKRRRKFYPPRNSNDNINPLTEWAYIITGNSGCTEFPFLLNIVVLSKCYSKLLKLKVWKALILRHSRGNEYGFNSRHQLAKNSLFTGFVRCQ